MKLSETQREALIHAYAPNYCLGVREFPDDDGFARQTVQSLARKGLIELDERGRYEHATLTQEGRRALGLDAPPPGELRGVVSKALELFVEWEPEAHELFFGDDVPPICVEEDELQGTSLWTDTTDVLFAFHDPCGGGFLGNQDVYWDAVARWVSESGYPVEADSLRGLVHFSRSDES